MLETGRLRLRAFALDDFPDFAAMWSDPVVMRYIGNKPLSRQEIWAKFLFRTGHWALCGFGGWVIEDKATKKFIGEIGFAYYKRDIEPSYDMPELGYVLASDAHGKGYATEAAIAVVAWGDRNLNERQTVCLIDADHVASLRVAEKLGYREFRRGVYQEKPIILLSREKP